MQITKEEILANRTPNGGYTKATLQTWGVPWPPPNGWQEALIAGGIPFTQINDTVVKSVEKRSLAKNKMSSRKDSVIITSEEFKMGNIFLKRMIALGVPKETFIDCRNLEELVSAARDYIGFDPQVRDGSPIKTVTDKKPPTKKQKEEFYNSWSWKNIRMDAIRLYGRRCQCCGVSPSDKTISGKSVRLCVDHIKPLSLHWDLRLDIRNLQILCNDCNMGKGNRDNTDFRR